MIKKEQKVTLFVRGVTAKNKKFIDKIAKQDDVKLADVVNYCIDKVRVRHEANRRKRTNVK